MKFSAKHSVKRLVAYASGNTNQYDIMVRTSGDSNPVLCVINHDDLLNIENEIRSAYEAGYQDANKNTEPTGHMTEEQLFQNLYRMVAGTNVTYKQVDSDLDEKGDVTIFFTIHPNLKGDNNAEI